MILYGDNKATCNIAQNSVQHDTIKHMEVDQLFIKDKLKENIIAVLHVYLKDQLTDVLIKATNN